MGVQTESPLHSPSPPYLAPEIPPPADPQTQYGLTSVIVPAKLRATVLSVCRAMHCPRAFSSSETAAENGENYGAGGAIDGVCGFGFFHFKSFAAMRICL